MKSGKMKYAIAQLSICLLSPFVALAFNDSSTVSSKLESAIVYRNGAELVHSAKAELTQGNNKLIIDEISNNIELNSIRIGCSSSVTLLSIEFSTEYLKPAIQSPFITRLADSIKNIKKELGRIDVQVRSNNDLLDLLRANREIRGTQTGLSVSELIKMMDYYKEKSLLLQTELNLFKEKQVRLNLIEERLQGEKEEEEKKNTKTTGRLSLQLLSASAGTFDFTIAYLTPTAYWNPSYELRVNNIKDPLKLYYKAKLVQTSGINWKKVKLSLSTSIPDQHADAPLLKTWFLRYEDPGTDNDMLAKVNSVSSYSPARLNEVVVQGYVAGVSVTGNSIYNEDSEPLYIVNGKPMSRAEFSRIDRRAIKKEERLPKNAGIAAYGVRGSNGVTLVTLKDELSDYVTVDDNELNVSFDIDIPYDVPSNGKEQYVVLKEYSIPAIYKYYGVPKLNPDSYLLAEIPGWAKYNLLPGEANVIFEGTYTGKSYIDPNSTADTLSLTLGKDKRVVVKREKITDFSSVKFLGTNKKQVFTYEITVKNNKKEEIRMQLKDQYPISSNKEIEAELLDRSGATVNEETGILNWKLELAPGEVKKFRVSYSIKYPKDKLVNSSH